MRYTHKVGLDLTGHNDTTVMTKKVQCERELMGQGKFVPTISLKSTRVKLLGLVSLWSKSAIIWPPQDSSLGEGSVPFCSGRGSACLQSLFC